MVFDRRVQTQEAEVMGGSVVGVCSECTEPWGTHHGGRVCCVCRKLVLVCDSCDSSSIYGEYWCSDHVKLRGVYFHFLDCFSREELTRQSQALAGMLAREPGASGKNRRATLRKKLEQVNGRLAEVAAMTDPDFSPVPLRRCRACAKPYQVCPGSCWGFWKRADVACDDDVQ